MFGIFSTLILIVSLNLGCTNASAGDHLESYRTCIYSCVDHECDTDGYSYLNDNGDITLSSLIQWPCFDECKYNCMWDTVDRLESTNVSIPQFHGKWPFIRIFGIQEPASTLFSLLNLILHFKWIRKFRKRVSHDAPLYWLWHIFAGVCINAWFWSVIFHARDTHFTEFMDYAGAFSIILVNCYVLLIRICWRLGKLYCFLISLFFFLFYVNHALYLYASRRIDYNYNMSLNFSIAIFSVVVWLLWCYWNRNSKPYVEKCATFVILTAAVALLEIIDRPPLYYIFDSHSIWHLSTAFLVGIFYRFGVSDCKHLKRQELKTKSLNFKKPL
ncbi:post-GPI attachment to proteins factor 3 [Coccinella septempunctata]|uniref:post-GPI attachment to proteins factor 3 n=1 Tax=Coccinella septempunctata TaxID=41139 RepID=UPI001D087283|nr:post-GPI attachment to proteins factor 3 [Coccinella septempunctata]